MQAYGHDLYQPNLFYIHGPVYASHDTVYRSCAFMDCLTTDSQPVPIVDWIPSAMSHCTSHVGFRNYHQVDMPAANTPSESGPTGFAFAVVIRTVVIQSGSYYSSEPRLA